MTCHQTCRAGTVLDPKRAKSEAGRLSPVCRRPLRPRLRTQLSVPPAVRAPSLPLFPMPVLELECQVRHCVPWGACPLPQLNSRGCGAYCSPKHAQHINRRSERNKLSRERSRPSVMATLGWWNVRVTRPSAGTDLSQQSPPARGVERKRAESMRSYCAQVPGRLQLQHTLRRLSLSRVAQA